MSAAASANNGKQPVIVKEQTFELAADNTTWMPTGKHVYVLYEDSSKKTVLTYKDKWVDILAAAKLAASFN